MGLVSLATNGLGLCEGGELEVQNFNLKTNVYEQHK